MPESVSLRTLVGGVQDACGAIAHSLVNLRNTVSSTQTSLLPMAAECFTTMTLLGRLGRLLGPGKPADSDRANGKAGGQIGDLEACFEVIVQSISEIILDVDYEITRLRRYSAWGDPLASSKFVPVLQDFFIDAKFGLRRNRSSLALMLDCLQSGNLLEATIQLFDQSTLTLLPSEKSAEPSRLRPMVAISLHKVSRQRDIQQQLAKYRPKHARPHKVESKRIRKLHNAIDRCNYGAVHKCLSDKVNPNTPLEPLGVMPIHRAFNQVEISLASDDEVAARESASIVTALVVAGARLEVLDEHGRSPLICAVKNEMSDSLITLMLEFGASVNATDRQRNTALHHAATKAALDVMGNAHVIQILLVHGADQSLRNERGRTALHEALSCERLDRARELLDYGANLEVADNCSWTPLFGAVTQGNAALTKLMCERGAVVDAKDKNGQTVLHYAISQGCEEIVEILVDAGADVNLISRGETPLCRAASKSSLSLVKLLLAHGADVTLPSPGYCGALPIHIAAMGNELAVLDILLEVGSPVNGLDDEQRTPLRWAMDGRKNEFVHFLLNKGAA
ncbi:ankyrin repeat-containing domain protein [Whalleya microplaca]|nr:ankyrin repeat-containing domain protein [Whalleya microplaca]